MNLHGPTIKAANIRQATPFLKVIADKYLTDVDNHNHVFMHLLIENVLEFNRLNYSTGMFFTQEELAAYNEATQSIGRFLQVLRQRANEAKQLLWHITAKTHYMMHFPKEARLVSPRLVQNYIEESYIGKIGQIWASCKNGPTRETIQLVALIKHLVWLCIELDL